MSLIRNSPWFASLAYWLAWLFIALMAFLVCWHASRLWRKNA